MTASPIPDPTLPPELRSGGARFHTALEICSPYVVGVFDLSARGGPEHTIVIRARSAAHTRKLATRLGDALGATAEGEAPDGTNPWMVIDGGDVVAHLLTDASLHRFGLIDLFSEHADTPDDVYAIAAVERLEQTWARLQAQE